MSDLIYGTKHTRLTEYLTKYRFPNDYSYWITCAFVELNELNLLDEIIQDAVDSSRKELPIIEVINL